MKENKNIEFLNKIRKISEMGIIGINDVIDKVKQSKFREHLENQRKEYDEILKEVDMILTSYGAEEQNLGKMVKINSKMESAIKLMNKEESDSTIAEMMVKGTSKGIEKIIKEMNSYNESDLEAYALAEKLLKSLENNMKGLKIYL